MSIDSVWVIQRQSDGLYFGRNAGGGTFTPNVAKAAEYLTRGIAAGTAKLFVRNKWYGDGPFVIKELAISLTGKEEVIS